MPTTILCPICKVDVVHLLHVFLDCKFAKQCWRLLRLDFEVLRVKLASGRLLERLTSETKDMMVQIVTGLWGIWSARNFTVWELKQVTPELVMQWSAKQVTQWRNLWNSKLGSRYRPWIGATSAPTLHP